MDPVSHVALGRTLLGLGSHSDDPARGAVAAVLLGALSPDIDSVFMLFGWDRYLRVHEAGTHTIIGTLGCALAVAIVVRALARKTRYRALVAAAWIGAASHVVLDMLSSARVRPAWPLVDTVVSLPMVAMADPWLVTLCVAGPAALWCSPAPRKRPAAAAVAAAIAGFLVIKAGLGLLAFSAYLNTIDQRGDMVQTRVIEAKWATLGTWNVSDRTASHVRSWRASASGSVHHALSHAVGEDTAIVAASRTLSTVRNFLRVHALGFTVTVPQAHGRQWVLWSDIRFCWDTATSPVPAPQPIVESPDGARMACALWFGGEFDSSGRPLREIVKVGALTQERPPTPGR